MINKIYEELQKALDDDREHLIVQTDIEFLQKFLQKSGFVKEYNNLYLGNKLDIRTALANYYYRIEDTATYTNESRPLRYAPKELMEQID